ncbi:MAG: hypothetical protein IJ217_00320 [Clostridia bacterium]|nr:hypothetical protein [Clostridia bacterium]
MDTEVLFKRKEDSLTITLDKNADYKTIKEKIREILSASDDLFEDLETEIIIEGRRLLDEEEKELTSLIAEKTDLPVKFDKPKQMGLASIDNIFNKDTSITNTKVYTGTLRSGQRIEFEGSIVVLGDVNSGSEVVAEENIVILGNLRGFAHAGAKGNRSAFIAANSITPTQIRIADIILRNTSEKKEIGNAYELAKIDMGSIVIEH